jgi:hypothetical protein
MRRWLVLLPPLFAAGLFLAFHASAGVRDTNASANVKVDANGQYELALANIGDGIISSFTFIPSSTMHVTGVVSSTKGSCQTSGTGFTCSVMLNPPPCACTAGDDVTVVFTGAGEIAGSKVDVMGVGITVTGTGAVGTTTSQTTTRSTTTTQTTPPPPPPAKVEKLSGSVGPTAKIAFTRSAKAGKAQITVHDMSKKDNFHLSGPGVNKKTGVAWTGKVTWTVTLKKGTYSFRSDAHASLHGTLRAS